ALRRFGEVADVPPMELARLSLDAGLVQLFGLPAEVMRRLRTAIEDLQDYAGRGKRARSEAELEHACRGANSPVPETAELGLVLSRDKFFGIGWRRPRGVPALQIGSTGEASIFVKLPAGRAHRVVVTVAKVAFEFGKNFRLEPMMLNCRSSTSSVKTNGGSLA